MKKLISIISIFVCAFAVFSCSDDDMANPYARESSISIESADVLFQAPASEGTIVCSAPNGITRIESSAGWCTVQLNGNVVNVVVDKNSEKPSRSCVVRIYASENDYKDVVVQQMGLVLSVNVGNDYSTTAAPQTSEFPITYSGTDELTVEESTVDWVTYTIEDGVLKLNFKTNLTDQPRTTEVTITDGDMVTTMKVTQGAFFFIVNDDNGYVTTNVSSKTDLTISTVDGIDYSVEKSSVDWATFSIENGQLRVELKANNTGKPRRTKAVITYAGDQTKEVPILQVDLEKDDMSGEYTFYYGTSGTKTMDCELVKSGSEHGLKFTGTPEGTIPVSINGSTMKFTNTEFVGDWKTASVTTNQAIVLLMYTNGSSVYRTSSTTSVKLEGTLSIDPKTAEVVWTMKGTAPSGYSFRALRVANTSAGTYASIKDTNITAWDYPSKLVKK